LTPQSSDDLEILNSGALYIGNLYINL